MHRNTMYQQEALNDFVVAINQRLLSKNLPDYIQKDPLIIGQCVHDVADGTAVYLMFCGERGSAVSYVKIGLARNIAKRMAGIAMHSPLPIRKALYFCTAGYGQAWALEQALHEKFRNIRIGGEWFKIDCPEDREKIVASMVEFADEHMGDSFNSFVYDPKKAKDPSIPKVREFVEMVWEITGSTGISSDTVKDLMRMGLSTDRHHRQVEDALNMSWGHRMLK